MIVFKVVHKETRYGSNATIFIQKNSIHSFLKLFEHFTGLKKYFPKYEKGKIIKCVPGSAGLMCFKSLYFCDKFMKHNRLQSVNCDIIKVRINKKNIMKEQKIISCCGDEPQHIIQYIYGSSDPPDGTIQIKQLYVQE
jgi:hypothetical protein